MVELVKYLIQRSAMVITEAAISIVMRNPAIEGERGSSVETKRSAF